MTKKDAVALISKSKDGEYLNKILTKWKYKTVRGSSAHSGKEALDEAIAMVRKSEAKRIVLTPDGPQGPKEIFKRGAFIAAKELDLPLYFLSIEYKRKKQLDDSWDTFQIPYPFSSVIITPHRIDITEYPSDPEEQRKYLEKISSSFQTSDPAEA